MFCKERVMDFRKQAGDSYKRLAANVQNIVGADNMKVYMPQVATALNWTAFNDGNPEARNRHGMEDRVNDLIKIQDMISSFIEYNMLRSYDDLIKVLRMEWAKRWSPKVLRDRKP